MQLSSTNAKQTILPDPCFMFNYLTITHGQDNIGQRIHGTIVIGYEAEDIFNSKNIEQVHTVYSSLQEFTHWGRPTRIARLSSLSLFVSSLYIAP